MKTVSIFFLIIISFNGRAQEPGFFERYFRDKTLRIDYYHTGDAKTEIYTPDKLYFQGTWAGNPDRCIRPPELGSYNVKVYDVASNLLIYSRGYSSIFAEYQTTGPALKGVKKTYAESVLIPLPRKPFNLVIEKRDRQNIPAPVFILHVDPDDYHIESGRKKAEGEEIIPVRTGGNPHSTVDLVILAEGYQAGEKEKFKKDLKYFTTLFFSIEPYRSRKESFNISGIFAPSDESGTDEPREGIYKSTRFGSSFDTFDVDRYCLDEDNKSIRDVAGLVAYDAIIIMVNRDRYGGGGIYNWQTVFCTGSPWHDYVFLHEFGHAFAGLGDEYFSSPVAYEDFVTPGVEPLEPNITILMDSTHVKWEKFLSPDIKVPTEWGKAVFDSLNQHLVTLKTEKEEITRRLVKEGRIAEIEMTDKEFQDRIKNVNNELEDFINNHPLKDKVGVFEGANYMSGGFYRPTITSLMHKFSDKDNRYGPVNEQAIISAIEYFTKD